MLRTSRILLVAVMLCTVQTTAHAMATKSKGLTMLVVPARYSVMQVAFDLLQKRDAVLLAYQGEASTTEPLLHAWNGQEWVYVAIGSYADASFIQVTPSQIVFVGDEAMVPTSLIDASAWCPLVMSIPSVDTASLVNSLGKIFSFRRADWKWFSSRYNLDLTDLNEDRRRTSWYDRPYVSSSSWRSYRYTDDDYLTGDTYAIDDTVTGSYSDAEPEPAAEISYEAPEETEPAAEVTYEPPEEMEPAEVEPAEAEPITSLPDVEPVALEVPAVSLDMDIASMAPAEDDSPEPQSQLDALSDQPAAEARAKAEADETSKVTSALVIEPVIDISRP